MLVVRLAGQVVCRGAPVPPSAWMSASTTATVYEHSGPVRAVGLVLQPEAAAALFATARGLVNTLRPLADLVGPRWAVVEHAVWAAADDGARLQVLCDFVRQWVAPPSPCEARRQQALALLHAASDDATDAGQRLGLSQRQFERRFVAHWGMAPKQFQVIARLNSTLGNALAAPGDPVVGLAVDQGYYDQSHMARDVQRHHKREPDTKAGRDAGPAPRAQAAVGRHPGRERHGGQVHVAGDAGGERVGKGVAPENIGHHAATGQKVHGVEVPGDGQAQGGQQQKKNAKGLVVVHRCKRPSKN
eukprot:gene149-148_t